MKTLITYVLIVLTLPAFGQQLTLRNDKSELKVMGTSTLHDWHLNAEELSGKAQVTVENGEVKEIANLTFNVVVEKLLSGKGPMDKNTFKALKSDTNPEIKYEFIRIISSEKQGNGTLLKTGGKLTIAGKTKSVYLDVLATANDGVSFKGQTTFKMSEYDVEPPVALMGTIKTGDEVTIEFNVKYN